MILALIVSQVLTWLVLGCAAIVLLALARQLGVLHERLAPIGALTSSQGVQPGGPAPRLTVQTLAGTTIELGGTLEAGMSRLLLFVSAQCPICKKIIPIATSLARRERLELIFLGDDEEDRQRAMIHDAAIASYPFVNDGAAGLAFGVDKLPQAILLTDTGIVAARGLVNSREHLESLVVARDQGVDSIQHYLERESANGALHRMGTQP